MSSIISHEAAMFCIALPTKNRLPAPHSPRKAGWASGLQSEAAFGAVGLLGFKRGAIGGGRGKSYRCVRRPARGAPGQRFPHLARCRRRRRALGRGVTS
ncbi:hypothetical protein [Variovorax sp. UC122_21]|uniref:hypothetical protein n=1 Tax=Variovorax sp. UC122_21 TaxID=3374554 RepID=UPI0037570F19